MTPTNNHILILPDEDLEGAMVLAGDRRWVLSVTGTVAAVPKRLVCNRDFYVKTRKTYGKRCPSALLPRLREAIQQSTEVETELQIEPGDRVLFSYLAHGEHQPKVEIDGALHLIVKYDLLTAKLGEQIIPLNGYLLVSMDEQEEGFYGVVKDKNRYGRATVVAAGSPVKYMDLDAVDDERISVGHKVYFEKSSAVRIEADCFNSLNPGRQSSLFRVRRKDITIFEGY